MAVSLEPFSERGRVVLCYLSSMLLAWPGCQVLTTLATAVTKNSCPISISRTASVCPGLASGTRLPYRSWSGW